MYRNESIDLLCKLMDWFLYDKDFRLKKVKTLLTYHLTQTPKVCSHVKQSLAFLLFFSVSIFFHEYHDSQDSREVKALYIFISLSISLYTLSLYISLYLFLPLPPAFRHLDISQVIAAENSPLNMAGSRT